MAKIAELNTTSWNKWVSHRPPIIQDLCKRLPPDRLYKNIPSGHFVTIISYFEDGTVKVDVSSRYNTLVFERQVFGVKADDLEECNLPSKIPEPPMLTTENDIREYCRITKERS